MTDTGYPKSPDRTAGSPLTKSSRPPIHQPKSSEGLLALIADTRDLFNALFLGRASKKNSKRDIFRLTTYLERLVLSAPDANGHSQELEGCLRYVVNNSPALLAKYKGYGITVLSPKVAAADRAYHSLLRQAWEEMEMPNT